MANFYDILTREERIDKENLNRALEDEKIPDYTKEFEDLKEACENKKVYLYIWRDLGVSKKEGYLKFIVNNVFFENSEEGVVIDLSKVAQIKNESGQVVYTNENRQNSNLHTFATIFGKLPAKAAFACRQEERQHEFEMFGKFAFTDFGMWKEIALNKKRIENFGGSFLMFQLFYYWHLAFHMINFI